MKLSAIHQYYCGSIFDDRVANGVLSTQRLLRAAGYRSEIYCECMDGRFIGQFKSHQSFENRTDQLLLVHFLRGQNKDQSIVQSAGQKRSLFNIKGPKLLIYNNTASSSFLPDEGDRGPDTARDQLVNWATASVFVGAITGSAFDAAELKLCGYSRIATIPLLINLERIRTHSWSQPILNRFKDKRNVLSVSPINANKDQLALVRATNILRTICDVPIRLILAGTEILPNYLDEIRGEIHRRRLDDDVVILEDVKDSDRFALYRAADIYLSPSELESLGIPLVEAMAFDVPILAVAAGAVPSMLASGGLLLNSYEPEAIAVTAKLVLEEPWLRSAIIRAQRHELERFEQHNILKSLSNFLRDLDIEVDFAQLARPPQSQKYWQIQGPFDNSYSLAIVNRELALALRQEGQSVSLQSRDGPALIRPDEAFLEANPIIETMWRQGLSVERPEVALRNQYPPLVADMKGEFRGLACYAWEESGFPHGYVREINSSLNLVTVTSRFVAKTLRDNGVHTPIRTVGDGIDQLSRLVGAHGEAQSEFLISKSDRRGDFCFLHVSSGFPRKGVDVLLNAWAHAFSGNDDVVLVIKTSQNPHQELEKAILEFDKNYPRHARIVLINKEIKPQELYELYRAADVIVCPTRGEGFGLPMAEAFAIGKPVITTAFGGQMDFCNPQNAWLCDYEFAYAQSHLNIPNSIWAEPRLESLIECLKKAKTASNEERASRGVAGHDCVLPIFSWQNVARRVQAAVAEVQELDTRSLRLPKIGWVSTWNSRCGIAAYSKFLTCAIAEDRLRVFATNNADPLEADPEFVARCWQQGWADPLEQLYEKLNAGDVDAVVIQFNFGFFALDALARLVERLASDQKQIYIILHSTSDIERPEITIRLADACGLLARARRILVHSVHDLNRLKHLGLVDNVTLFPHGLMEGPAAKSDNSMRTISNRKLVASFGYLLPHKGLRELIEAIARLRRDGHAVDLLLLNALYPVEESEHEYHAIETIISRFGLGRLVRLKANYLPEHEILTALAEADLIVYPYQNTQESVSGAVRLGLSSLRPVATTPLRIFDDVASVTHRLPGIAPTDLARGIGQLLSDDKKRLGLAERQRAWVNAHSWSVLSQRLDGLIRGEFVDGLLSAR